MKIKQGDMVLVRTGKNKGTKGTVTRVIPALDKIVVEGVNIAKKHVKSRRRGSKGQTIEVERPIHVSNVALVDEKTGKAGRVGYIIKDDGTKERVVKHK